MASSLSSRSVLLVVVDPHQAIGLATPTQTVYEVSGPLNEKFEWDLLSVSYNPGSTAVADAGGVTLAVDKVTSGAGATTHLLTATSIVAGAIAADTPTELLRGRTSLVAGDHIVLTFATDGAVTTPAVGASVTLEFEITERSGA